MRHLRRASPLARIVATLGVLIVVQAIAVLRYGADDHVRRLRAADQPVDVLGITISVDRFILLGIAAVLSAALWAFYRYTKFGLATTAVAENQRAASSIGLSPDFLATINWALGSALAGVAAILIAPIVQLQVATMTNLVLAALATALVAGFRSFPIAFAGGMLIGIGQTELDPLRRHAGHRQLAAVRRHRAVDDPARPGPAAARLLLAAAAGRRHGPDPPVGARRRARRHGPGHPAGAAPVAGRLRHHVRRRPRAAVAWW